MDGCDMCVCLGGKFSVRHNFLPSKFFLSADQPRHRKRLSIHSRQTAGEFQVSFSTYTVKRSKIPVPPLPAGKTPFALLELPGSPPLWVAPVSQAQTLCGNLCTSTEPVGPPACGPSARYGWSKVLFHVAWFGPPCCSSVSARPALP